MLTNDSRLILAMLALSLCAPVQLCAEAVHSSPVTYESHVRPILKKHCFHCHGEDEEPQGNLDLRLFRLLSQGGDSGPVVVPGQPSESSLFSRLRDGEMPPKEIATRPTVDELATIEQWIADGAVSVREEPADLNPDEYLTEEERSYWAFQPVRRPALPQVTAEDRVRNPIDRFVLGKLEASGLTCSGEADRTTLARRLYFDLWGLPPTPRDIDAFLQDASPDAYERLVDRLLASSHYGERWGRHWLDVAGYADSEGYTDDDPLRPDAYKYRDYVIRAFNADKPFHEFLVEQLAGDELIQSPLNNLAPQDAELLIATGFLRMAPDGTGVAGVDQNMARNEVMAKTIEIVSTSLLGLTVGCAQCHNHRYDPISQADYYALRAVFEPALDWKQWLAPTNRRVSLYTDADRAQAATIETEAQQVMDEREKQQAALIQATFERELAKLPDDLRGPITAARNTPEKERTAEQKNLLKKYPSVNVSAGSLYLYDQKAADELKKLADQATEIRNRKPKEEFVRALWEVPGKTLPKTFLFYRGDCEQPKQELPPRELRILTMFHPVELPLDDPALPGSGRRLAYARWLTTGEHPLVARVLVNRIWLNHFGLGLVPTPGDFGRLGAPPTHPELLDWLASELVASGWSTKHLQRLIVTSTTYRQASSRNSAGNAVDADNTLYWRMPLRRLEAETLRDSLLALSGELNTKPFGPAVPVMADEVGQFVIGVENLDAGRPGKVIPMQGEEFRRSVYVQVRRSRPLSVMSPFDLPRMEPNCTVRSASTVSPQSLLLMNSEFTRERALAFARRVQREAGAEPTAQIVLAWRLALSAEPTPENVQAATSFLTDQTAYFAGHPDESHKEAERLPAALEALASYCHALLSSNAFLYVD